MPLKRRKRGCWKHKLDNASLSRNLRETVRSGIETRLRVTVLKSWLKYW